MNETRTPPTWGSNMTDLMVEHDISRKQLVQEFARLGHPVSEQAVGAWLRGEYAPRQIHQAVFARIVRTPAHLIFPVSIEAVAA